MDLDTALKISSKIKSRDVTGEKKWGKKGGIQQKDWILPQKTWFGIMV